MEKNTTQTVFIVLLVVCAFFIGSLWTKVQVLEKQSGGSALAAQAPGNAPQAGAPAQPPPPTGNPKEVPKLTKEDHVRGDRNARLAIIEYSDIECPFCKSFHPTVRKALDEYKGKVSWVFRHYPLSFHANAQKEAEAAECAALVGGNDVFWTYVDTVFERTTSNGTGFALDKLIPLANELGINEGKFKDCLDKGTQAKHVKEDMDGGTKAGVSGTPGTIILDTKAGDAQFVNGAVPFEQLKTTIDGMLK